MKKNMVGKSWISLAAGCLLACGMMIVSCSGKNSQGGAEALNEPVVLGIDVSEYQGQIEWDKLAIAKDVVDSCISEEYKAGLPESLPVSFVFIRATKSSDYVDQLYQTNFEAARLQGVCRGAYHFLTDTVSGRKQAENFISVVKLEEGDLAPVLDIEVFSPGVADIAKEWLSVVEEHYGREAVVYSNRNGFNDIIAKDSVLKSRELWMAQLNAERPEMENCRFWQFSHKGKVTGISENVVDINLFFGDFAQLKGNLLKYN